MNTDYPADGLVATTLKHYVKSLEDNVFTSRLLMWILKSAGKAPVNIDGGEKIVQPLMYAKANNKGSYAGSDTFTTLANTGITAAEFPWKQYYGLISIEGIELAKNQGSAALLRLLETRMKQIELTIGEEMEAMLFGDGSGNAGKDFYGLGAIIDSSNPSWGNLGGIDRSTYDYWQASETAHNTTLTVAVMRTKYNDVSEGADQPTNVLTTQTLHEKYEALIQANQRFTDSRMADAGFQNLMFSGAPIAFSPNVTAGEVLFLNTKYLELNSLSGTWFKPSDMMQPTNQDVYYKHLLCYGNLTVSNCKRQGKITGATA
jgi:hypothetical protein